MSKQDFLTLSALSEPELLGLLRLAKNHRDDVGTGSKTLANKSLAMLFSKASTRTRVSFDVAMYQLGGHALMLSDKDSQIGRGEPIEDTARVLSRYVDGIMIRTFSHELVERLARYSSVPVINGLTDFTHPCQVLADLLTCVYEFGEQALKTMRVTWIGDGNNMTRSWVHAAQRLGFELHLCSPAAYALDQDFIDKAKSDGARVRQFHDPVAAAAGADVVTTDVWASMGDESESEQRLKAFEGFTVDSQVMSAASDGAIFLHCLPVHRGEEAASDVVDGPQSRIWDEAENRLHVQKAILEWTMAKITLP